MVNRDGYLLLPYGRFRSGARPAFTLVELLTVVAVLAVLAGMLFPVLERARERGRRGACLARLRQVGQAHFLYLQDWSEQFPAWAFPAQPARGGGQFPFVSWPPITVAPGACWVDYLQPYLRSRGVIRDPGGPTTEASGERRAEYALLTWGPGGGGTRENPYWRWPGPGMMLAGVARPGETLLVVEGVSTPSVAWREAGRHGNGANAAFVDGHARWLRTREFERVESDGRGGYWLRYAAADR